MTTFRTLLPWRREDAAAPAVQRDPFLSLQPRMHSLFDDFFQRDWVPFGAQLQASQPRLDVVEQDDAYLVSVELPGVAEDDVELSVTDDVLTIRGEKRAEERSDEDGLHRVERTYGAFERRIGLGPDVDAAEAHATFDKGVLTVRLPKRPEVQEKTRTIPVRSGD